MANLYGRQVVLLLTNKSGGALIAGDVVIVDTSNDTAVTTTTSARVEVTVGVAQEAIASNAIGRVLTSGYAALVNVPASVTRGHYVETHTVAKQATGSGTRRSGSFGQFLTGGTTPTAVLWGSTDQTASGGATTPAFVGVRGKRTAAQTITTATLTAISFNAADDYDTNAFHDPAGANPSRFIVPSGKDGYYLAIANLQWDVSTTGARLVAIKKNGTTLIAEIEYNPNFTPVDGQGSSISTIVLLAATDYLELVVYHTKGSNLDTRATATAEGCNFQMGLLGT